VRARERELDAVREVARTPLPAARGQLTLHADRGTSMSSKPVAFLLADLGVTKTHSRPHVSDDNPYSESQFRTMNIGRSSRTASGVFRTAARSARDFSVGTTMNTATPAWRCSRRRWFTTDRVRSSSNSAKPCSTELIQLIQNALSGRHHDQPRFRPKSGSTNAKLRKQNSINSEGMCLRVVDTRRKDRNHSGKTREETTRKSFACSRIPRDRIKARRKQPPQQGRGPARLRSNGRDGSGHDSQTEV